MNQVELAKRIGYKQAFKAITVGLAIAYFIYACLAGPLWFFEIDWKFPIVLAVFVSYTSAYLIGQVAGTTIILKKWPNLLVGMVSGLVIVWMSTFIASLIGFFKEGLINEPIKDAAYDYLLKPLILVTTFGFIPIIFVGVWFGYSIKRNAR